MVLYHPILALEENCFQMDKEYLQLATWNSTMKTYLSLTVFAIKSMVISVFIGNIKSVYEYYKCIQLGGKIHNMMT